MMKLLSYRTLEETGYQGYLLKDAPEKVLQFGEGNFLRAFVEHWFDLANEWAGWNGKCLLVQPTPAGRTAPDINAQGGLYTLYLKGIEQGKVKSVRRVISAVSRCVNPYTEEGFEALMEAAVSDDLEIITSNTTEAGIMYDPQCHLEDRPAATFPGKLTQVLYRRFQEGKPGVLVLPCELIDHNGAALLDCVSRYISQWGLGEDFRRYCGEACTFCSTLVDRIVPGKVRDPEELERIRQENGYEDTLADVGEIFGVWNIEGPAGLEDRLPFKRAGIANCVVVPDVAPYKKRKVRILNGAHTGIVLGAYLAGYDIVRDCMKDPVIKRFFDRMVNEEIIPTLPLDRRELERFAADVYDRFLNPFVDHALLSISLNSTAKWRARNLPSLLACTERTGHVPACLAMGFAAYLAFYTSGLHGLTDNGLLCRRPGGEEYVCRDDRWVMELFWAHRESTAEELAEAVMRNERLWGMDLTTVPGFRETVCRDLNTIRREGAAEAFAGCLHNE